MQPTAQSPREAASRAQAHTLDSLAALDAEELGRLYAAAPRPKRLDALDGTPLGRMLAVRFLDRGVAGGLIRSFARASFFPWGGKTFTSSGIAEGRGVNRVHLFGRHELFPFLTRLAPSVVDGEPAIVLDYDLADNPAPLRRIHDEVREVSPGLYLGPALWKSDVGTPSFVLWFALDTKSQARPIGTN